MLMVAVLLCSEKTIAPFYIDSAEAGIISKFVCVVLCVLVWAVLFLSFGMNAQFFWLK
jgi:hypothetical protein